MHRTSGSLAFACLLAFSFSPIAAHAASAIASGDPLALTPMPGSDVPVAVTGDSAVPPPLQPDDMAMPQQASAAPAGPESDASFEDAQPPQPEAMAAPETPAPGPRAILHTGQIPTGEASGVTEAEAAPVPQPAPDAAPTSALPPDDQSADARNADQKNMADPNADIPNADMASAPIDDESPQADATPAPHATMQAVAEEDARGPAPGPRHEADPMQAWEKAAHKDVPVAMATNDATNEDVTASNDAASDDTDPVVRPIPVAVKPPIAHPATHAAMASNTCRSFVRPSGYGAWLTAGIKCRDENGSWRVTEQHLTPSPMQTNAETASADDMVAQPTAYNPEYDDAQ